MSPAPPWMVSGSPGRPLKPTVRGCLSAGVPHRDRSPCSECPPAWKLRPRQGKGDSKARQVGGRAEEQSPCPEAWDSFHISSSPSVDSRWGKGRDRRGRAPSPHRALSPVKMGIPCCSWPMHAPPKLGLSLTLDSAFLAFRGVGSPSENLLEGWTVSPERCTSLGGIAPGFLCEPQVTSPALEAVSLGP